MKCYFCSTKINSEISYTLVGVNEKTLIMCISCSRGVIRGIFKDIDEIYSEYNDQVRQNVAKELVGKKRTK